MDQLEPFTAEAEAAWEPSAAKAEAKAEAAQAGGAEAAGGGENSAEVGGPAEASVAPTEWCAAAMATQRLVMSVFERMLDSTSRRDLD